MHSPRRRFLIAAIAGVVSLASAMGASGQAYPSKSVKLIVTFPAGGGADFVARVIAPRLGDALGQSVVVDNRAGANGAIGNEAVAHSAPDGYTLLLGAAGALTIAPHLQQKTGFDTFNDFVPIALVGSSPFVLVVNPSLPVNSVRELTALAKANPGKYNFGSSGTGGAPHLAGELYKRDAGIDIVHVPYKGLAPAITDLLGGQVQILFADVGLVAQHVKTGKLKALAVTSRQRSSTLPDVPTMVESGVAGYSAGTWYGVLAPKGTAPEIVARLNTEIDKILASGEVKTQFAAQGVEVGGDKPEQFANLIRDDYTKWAKLIKEAGIKGE
ncbi:MAG TPA: tripartite tricarboxylate transporter substrate binding protein [Casimicrobiaceae bacterium]|nr:tripartite tricarboxylate transporter substrate binding protein [Casimicrobiaceae bacterium]